MADAPHLVPPDGPAPGSPGAGLVAVPRRIVSWDMTTGEPVVRTVQVFTKAQVSEIAMAAASLPYAEPGDELAVELGLPPSEFYGRPILEVMLIRQARNAARTGDSQEVERVLDRLVGKPKQTSESHRITETYEEFLKRVSQSEVAGARPVEPIEPEDSDGL